MSEPKTPRRRSLLKGAAVIENQKGRACSLVVAKDGDLDGMTNRPAISLGHDDRQLDDLLDGR